jgi:hypothetical protein
VIDGRGQPGFVKATASVTLLAEGSATRLRYLADAQVGGKIASIGQRLIDASAKAIAKQSLDGLHANVKVRAAATADDADDGPAPAAGEAKPADEAPVETAPVEEALLEQALVAEAAATAAQATAEDAEAPAEGRGREARDSAAEGESAPSPAKEAGKLAKKTKRRKKKPVAVIKTDQAAFAASVAKEVGKSLVPAPVLYALLVAAALIVLWLVLR